MSDAQSHWKTNIPACTGAFLFVLGFSSSLFFQKVNAEYFAIAGFSCIALLIFSLWTGKSRLNGFASAPLLAISAFWVWLAIATLLSPVFYISAGTLWTFAALPAVAWSIMFMRYQANFQSMILAGFLIITIGLAIYACIQFFLLEQSPRATFLNRNNFAALLIPVTLLALSYSLKNHQKKSFQGFWLAILALFTFVIALIGSRGAIISLALGVLFVFNLGVTDQWPKKALASAALTMLLAFGASSLTTSGIMEKKLEELKDPYSAGNDRFIIWNASLDLARDAPWYGIGPGLYPSVYPKYRSDDDRSAAYFVHNDYLQLFIEAGWPALGFILLTMAGLIWQLLKILRIKTGSRPDRLRLITLFSGLTCIAGHSLLTFNLYLLPILIAMGLLLGLLTNLMGEMLNASPVQHSEKPIKMPTRIAITLVMLIPGLYLIETIRGSYYYQQGTELAQAGNFLPALELLDRAIEASPKADLYPYTYGWFWLKNIQNTKERPDDSEVEKVFAYLERSEKLNPLRPQPHVIRAMLYQNFPALVDSKAETDSEYQLDMVEKEYRDALAKDPFFLEARFYLARLLLQQNLIEEGVAILEAGMNKSYRPSNLATNYYRLTAEMRRITGDDHGYRELKDKMKDLARRQENYERKQASERAPGLF